MFDCLCLKKFSKRKNLIAHLKSHEILNQFKFPSGCLQTNCKHGSNFNDFAQLNRHLRLFHKKTVNEENNLLTAQIEDKGDENVNRENEMEIDFINSDYNIVNRRKLIKDNKFRMESNLGNNYYQKCKDSGESYSASYLITKEHLILQRTNYNLS